MEQASFMRRVLLVAILTTCTVFCTTLSTFAIGEETENNIPPIPMNVVIIENYSHDSSAFTQGLIWHEGSLYESTGLYGNSSIREVNLSTGEVVRSVQLNASLFGEGLALVGENLVQLTWKNNTAIIWDLNNFTIVGNFTYDGEGWGLCNDGMNLIMSNGTDVLTVRDSLNFTIIREINVTLNGTPQISLNELECNQQYIWANIWGQESIVRINSTTGVIDQIIDASILLEDESINGTGVLNGIAIDGDGKFLLTGKNWPLLYRVEIVEVFDEELNQSESNNQTIETGDKNTPSNRFSILLMLVVFAMIVATIMLIYKISRERQTDKG